MNTLSSLIKAVEENNELNGASWTDWSSLSDIEEVYGSLEDEDFSRNEAELIINKAIETNGASITDFDNQKQKKQYGEVKFSK